MPIVLALATSALADPLSTSEWRAALADQAGWEEVSRKTYADVGEILIRHKEIAGQHCLEGTTRAALSPDVMLQVAADIPNQPSFSSWDVPASVQLTTGDHFDYYQVLDNPSPVSDRYWFVSAVVKRVGDDRVFTWELADPSRYPEALASVKQRWPDAVMTRVNVGDWTFTPEGATTRVRYRICTDAGGSIPRWVGEFAATRTLPTNISDIVKEVRRRVGK